MLFSVCNFDSGAYENSRAFDTRHGDGRSRSDEIALGQHGDALTVDRCNAGRTQIRSRHSRLSDERMIVGRCNVIRALFGGKNDPPHPRIFRKNARRSPKDERREHNRDRKRLRGYKDERQPAEGQEDSRNQRDCTCDAGDAVTRKDVQLEHDENDTGNAEQDDERIAEPRIDVRTEKQRERSSTDRTGDSVQRLQLDQKSEKSERQEHSAHLRIRGEARKPLAKRIRRRHDRRAGQTEFLERIFLRQRDPVGEVRAHGVIRCQAEDRARLLIWRDGEICIDHSACNVRIAVRALAPSTRTPHAVPRPFSASSESARLHRCSNPAPSRYCRRPA